MPRIILRRRAFDENLLSSPTSEKGRLQRALFKLYEEHRDQGMLPTSNRFLYYELITQGVIDKHRKGARRSDQPVIEALTSLRELGMIPWDAIVDETRDYTSWRRALTVADYLRDALRLATIDPWGGLPPPVIITESRSLRGVLENLMGTYSADITSVNGMSTGHLYKIAKKLTRGQSIAYLGDLDVAGGDIENHTRTTLEKLVGPLDWARLAITMEQVEEYDLIMIDKEDRRFIDPNTGQKGRAFQSCETEALSQRVIVEMVRAHLDLLLPEPLSTVLAREQEERDDLHDILASL